MSRIVLAAGAGMIVVLLAGFVLGPPGEDRVEPVDQVAADPWLLPPDSVPRQTSRRRSLEISTILEARRQLGSVVEGSVLDPPDSGEQFVRSLEQILPQ